MPDRKEALQILGLEETASSEEIEKRYDSLLKRYHIQMSEGSGEKDIDLEKVNEAYGALKHIDYEENQTKSSNIFRPVLKLLKLDEKKAANIYHYYKIPVLVILIVLIVVSVMAVAILTNKPPDLKVVYVGDYMGNIAAGFEEKIEDTNPRITKARVTVIPFNPMNNQPSLNVNYIKIIAMYNAEDMDVAIVDTKSFDFFVRGKLIGSIEGLGFDKKKNERFVVEENGKKILYGVDVTNSKFLKGDKIQGKTKIAVILKNTKFSANAQKFIQTINK